jgi:hypothetical protein
MFIGHYAVGLASKKIRAGRFVGRSNRRAYPARSDLAGIFLLGWEQVAIVPNGNPFLRLQFYFYPISHGLVAVIGWATLYAAIYFGMTRYVEGTVVIWMGVVSHWLLDYVVHTPDLPPAAGSRLLGLGLWNHRWLTIAIEVTLFAVAIWTYQRERARRTKLACMLFWVRGGFLAVMRRSVRAGAGEC